MDNSLDLRNLIKYNKSLQFALKTKFSAIYPENLKSFG